MMADSSEKMYCVPCCTKCEDKCFCEDTALHVQILNHEPHARVAFVRATDKTSHGALREKNHVCGNVTLCAGLVSCVHSRRCKRIAIACKRKHLESVFKKIAHSMMKISTMKLLANLRMKNLLMDGRTTSIPFWGQHEWNPLHSPYIVDFVVVELDPWCESGVAISMLLIQSLMSYFSFLVIVSFIHNSVFSRSV